MPSPLSTVSNRLVSFAFFLVLTLATSQLAANPIPAMDTEVAARGIVETVPKMFSMMRDDGVNVVRNGSETLYEANLLFPGRSLPLYYAQFELMATRGVNSNSLHTFPISGFSPGPNIDPNLKPLLYDHFDNFISIDTFGNKPIYILDYTQSGESLFSVTYYLKEWLEQKGKSNKVVAFAIDSGVEGLNTALFSDNGVQLLKVTLENETFEEYFMDSIFDSVSPNIEYNILQPPQNAAALLESQQQKYQEFKSHVEGEVVPAQCRLGQG